jgi:hypothetical protein
MFYHNGSVAKALLDLFPNIGLNAEKLRISLRMLKFYNKIVSLPSFSLLITLVKFRNIDNRRKFFENYAKEQGFDPRDPNNWYSQSTDKIITTLVHYRLFSYVYQPIRIV